MKIDLYRPGRKRRGYFYEAAVGGWPASAGMVGIARRFISGRWRWRWEDNARVLEKSNGLVTPRTGNTPFRGAFVAPQHRPGHEPFDKLRAGVGTIFTKPP